MAAADSSGAHSSIYSLRMQARALAPVVGNSDRHRFLVGSCELKHDNEIHLLDFDEEEMELTSTIYRHPADIWQLSPCPSKDDLVFTIHSQVNPEVDVTQSATLWRMPAVPASDKTTSRKISSPLESLLVIEAGECPIRNVLWNPASENSDSVMVLDENAMRIVKLDDGFSCATASEVITAPTNKGQIKFTQACWNPHSRFDIATANDTSLRGWDIRTSKQTFVMEQAHAAMVRDLDYNPNKPNMLCSVGDDCKIRFWDLRNTKSHVKEIMHHSHWVWSVHYNRFHDQLVLTSGSDGQVVLHCVSSLSSNPLGESVFTKDDDQENSDPMARRKSRIDKAADGILATFDQHEESVYTVAWSSADPWVLASVSYDGRVAVSMVPNDVKYKIIL